MPKFSSNVPNLTDFQRQSLIDYALEQYENSGEVELFEDHNEQTPPVEIREDAEYPGSYWMRAWVCVNEPADDEEEDEGE